MANKPVLLLDTPVRILGERPTIRPAPNEAPIPADATIYNARRRLFGTPVDGMGLTWEGDAIGSGGIHYAAVLSNDPHAQAWMRTNRALGAFVVEYVSIAQVREAAAAFYAEASLMEPAEVVSQLAGDSDRNLGQKSMDSGLDDRVPA
jgi:hypothetical protein